MSKSGFSVAVQLRRSGDSSPRIDLPSLSVPTLAVHGVNDPIAPIGAVRAYAEQIEALQLVEFAGARHDVLNEVQHRDVAAAIIDFIHRSY